ncbi:MAG: VanZ family protein [Hydrogenophaga sp.]
MKPVTFWLALLALSVLSLVPVGHLPPAMFSLWDKAQHALGFGGLMLLGVWAYPVHPRRLASGLLCHGAIIEILQYASGWRQGDWADLSADALGIGLAMALWWGARSWRRTECGKH